MKNAQSAGVAFNRAEAAPASQSIRKTWSVSAKPAQAEATASERMQARAALLRTAASCQNY